MNATWSLFKIFRQRLWIFMTIEISVVLFIALNDIRRYSADSAMDSVNVSFILALVLSLGMQIQSRLNRLPFPATPRQRINLPILSILALWGSGLLTLMGVVTCMGFSADRWFWILAQALMRIPLYGLAFLWIYRLIHLKPYLISFVVWIFILPGITHNKADSPWNDHYVAILLASLGLIAFYWKEIQHQFTQQDHLSTAQKSTGRSIFQIHDMNITPRQTGLTWIGNTLDASILLGFVIWAANILFKVLRLSKPIISFEGLLPNPMLCVIALFMPYWMFILIRDLHRRTIASGFSTSEAFGLTLLQSTIIFSPLAQIFGVKKGVAARCTQCHTAKFIWAQYCPHCGFAGQGTLINKKLNSLGQGRPMKITLRQRFDIRLFIPLQCLFLFCFLGIGGRRPFIIHPVHLSFADAQTAQAASSTIQDWIANHQDANTWLSATGHPVAPPKKYRLNVRYREGENYMSIWDYGLRWDSAEGLGEVLAEDLKRCLPATQSFTAKPTKEMESVSPFGQLRTYLDNQIHWKE